MIKEQVLKQIKFFDENYQTLFSNIDDLDKKYFIDFGFNGMTQIVEDGKIINSDILENYAYFKNELNKFTNINLGNS